MPDNVFIDSNLWVYSFIETETEAQKRQTTLVLLEELSQQSNIVISLLPLLFEPIVRYCIVKICTMTLLCRKVYVFAIHLL